MATLERRGQSFRIIFRFGGVRYARALSTRDERAAEASRSRVEDKIHRLELGTLELPTGVDVLTFLLSDGRRQHSSTPSNASPQAIAAPLSLADLFAAYWSKLPDGSLEASTIAGMKLHERHLEKHFGKQFTIGSLSVGDLQGYIAHRSHAKGFRGRNVTPVTIKKAIVTLRTIWNWARHHGHFDRPFPSRGLRFPKGTEKPPFMTFAEVEKRARSAKPAEAADLWERAFLSLEEIGELLKTVKSAATHASLSPMFVFAAHTGARRSEIIRSQLGDLDFDNNLITVRERKKSHDKRTTRRVPMSPLLRETLLAMLEKHPGGEFTFWYEFPATRGHYPILPRPLEAETAHRVFKQTLAGSKWEKLRGWHVFRHSFCSNCAAKGVDQRIIDAWVGHLSPDMVRRYRHLLPDQQQNAIAAVFGSPTHPTVK